MANYPLFLGVAFPFVLFFNIFLVPVGIGGSIILINSSVLLDSASSCDSLSVRLLVVSLSEPGLLDDEGWWVVYFLDFPPEF